MPLPLVAEAELPLESIPILAWVETPADVVESADHPVGAEDNWSETLRRVREWSSRDQSAALAWAAALQNGEERQVAQAEICYQLAERNPAEAAALAARLNFGDAGSEALLNLVEHWASADLPAAQAWAAGQPSGERRERFLERIASVMARTAPADAARLVAEQIPSGPVQFSSAITVLGHWAVLDFSGAWAWANLFPEDGSRETAVEKLTRVFPDPSPEAP